MKKAVIVAFVLALVMSAGAFATETRTLVMGNNNMIMMDDANVWLFPSRINNYGNLATAEFSQNGSDDFYNFGLNWKFGEAKPWVLGTYFSTEGDNYPVSYTGQPLGYYFDLAGKANSLVYEPSLNNRSFDLLYGRQLGGFLFGAGLGYNHASVSGDTSDFKASFSQYVVSLGLTGNTGNWDVAAQVGFGTWTDKDNAGTELSKPDGYTDIAFQGRFFYKYNQTLTFVPHAQMMFGSRGEKFDASLATPDYKESRTAFELGAGMNYTPVTNVLAVLDFGFQYEKVKTEQTGSTDINRTVTHIPYFRAGLEGEVFSWMDVRFGAISNWEHFKLENVSKSSVFDNSTYLGVGLNFNRLHLDTYMDPQIVLDGFNFVSGSSDAEDLNFQVTALYELF